MDSITSFFPTLKLIPFLISLGLLILISLFRKSLFKNRKWLWISSIVFLSVYIFILVSTEYLSDYYYSELQKFDLDGNGNFTIDERSLEQEKAMRKVTNDTARNFSFITGLIWAAGISLITYLFGKVIEKLSR